MDRSQASKRRLRERLFAVGVLLVVIFFATPLAPYFRGVFVSLFARQSTNAALSGLSRNALIARVATDEAEISQIKYEATLYGLVSSENTKLLQELHGTPPATGILARVVSRPPEIPYDTILIDEGSVSGISEGDTVVYQGIALGKVISTGNGSALVKLFSNPGTEEDALVGDPGAIAVASGLGGGALQLSVPEGVSVSVGDSVRMEGSETLLLGIVGSVSTDTSNSTRVVLAYVPVSFADLDFVDVLPSPQ